MDRRKRTKGEDMIAGNDSEKSRRLNFWSEASNMRDRVREPLAEKVLLRFPRIAALLAAAGARGLPGSNGGNKGTLAAMMTASGSIEGAEKTPGALRFNARMVH